MYADRRLPEAARRHEVALGECLGGALYVNDFIALCKQVGGRDGGWGGAPVTGLVWGCLGVGSTASTARAAPCLWASRSPPGRGRAPPLHPRPQRPALSRPLPRVPRPISNLSPAAPPPNLPIPLPTTPLKPPKPPPNPLPNPPTPSQVGFTDPRVLSAEPIEVRDAELEGVLGGAKFFSATFRWGRARVRARAHALARLNARGPQRACLKMQCMHA